MKAGWEVKPLGELCRIELGSTPARKSPKFWDNERQTNNVWLSIADLPLGTKEVVSKSKEHVTDLAAKTMKVVPKGTLMASFKLSLGRLAFAGCDLRTNEAIAALHDVDAECLDVQYLYWFLTFFDWDEAAKGDEKIKGKTLNKAKLKALLVILPPLEEQKRIVAVLDAAFEGLDRARTHIQTNLQNARELFEGYLKDIFRNDARNWIAEPSINNAKASSGGLAKNLPSNRNTKTGGRAAAERHILGDFSLSVKVPQIPVRSGWRWSLLTDLARLESGHTPSRRKPEYWGGDICWIGIKDARDKHGGKILQTLEKTNELGIDNSSARVLPKGTVCLSRTASVGYVTVMGREMATSQDFVNWVCGDQLEPDFLKLILLAQGNELSKFSSGAVHQTIYFPEAKAFAICHPDVKTQRRVVEMAAKILSETTALIDGYTSKLADLDDLRQSLLQKAFAGELT